MSVNLSKNHEALVAAWTSVVDDKSPVDWAVFGYEGQTNNLKVVGTGNGGLQEMIEELNSGHIMYAFCRVVDTKTSLPKCVLVNWQGELAPIVRKGTCANHIRDIERLLKGAHIQVNARSEEDVEVDLIMEKLARATGSAYKFQAPRSKDVGNTPVGTAYKRVIPAQEINATERDEFWQKEELEEKARIEQEKIRKEKERQRVELETRSREEKQSKIREDVAVPVVRKMEQSQERVQELKNLRNQAPRNESDEEEPKSRSDELRRQRSNEAQQLIAQRTINARAVFEQNSAAGQMRGAFGPSKSPRGVQGGRIEGKIEERKIEGKDQGRKVINEASGEVLGTQPQVEVLQKVQVAQEVHKVAQTAQEVLQEVQGAQEVERKVLEDRRQDIETERKALEEKKLQDTQKKTLEPEVAMEEHKRAEVEWKGVEVEKKVVEDHKRTQEVEKKEEINTVENELYNQLSGENYLYFDPNNEGMKARALYDYQAADDTEITFDPGDVITHIDAIDEGWWQGLAPDGTYGLFPANYVEVIEYAT
ncbi:drebrin-like protein [Fopius arisanus]|uniref:CG10083 protein n=1 Tax=Fopius arisanus TaxID=64838 RepID=A0A0C9R7B4_9HYME|nr:PREDICTED: drebrin-like protein [Fopius arisanus]